jgi:monoterpene epsilon-lactone hydrolase
MASIPAKLLKTALSLAVKHKPRTQERLKRRLRLTMNAPLLPSSVPSGISLRPATIAGVPGEWLEPAESTMTILYFHGGAFLGGTLRTYHRFCGELAKRLNARVFMPDYRLAPEHPFPAAVNDAFSVFKSLSAECGARQPLVVAGDSAGGNLSLVTLMRARDEGLPAPLCGILISPGTDATGSFPSLSANSACDVMLSGDMINMAIDIYLNGADPTQPHASPCLGDFTDLPPMMVSVSEEECLRDDAYHVVESARRAGVATTLLSRQDMPHVWPIFFSLLPEARQDMPKFIDFVHAQLASATRDLYASIDNAERAQSPAA